MKTTQIPPLTGIIETCLYVEKLERSIAFYRKLFGCLVEIHDEFICVLRIPENNPNHALILFPTSVKNQPPRTSTPAGSVTGIIPDHGAEGRMHIGFSIPKDQIEAWEHRLSALNIAIDAKVTWKRGGVSLYFRDPDRHMLELITPGIWTFY